MSKRKMCPRISAWCEEEGKYWIIGREVGDSGTPLTRIRLASKAAYFHLCFGISSQTGAMLRAQEVLLDKIESIAQRVETLSKEVLSMKEESARIEMRQQDRSWLPSDEEIKAWLNSPVKSPTHGSIMDLTCSETPYPSLPPLNVNQFTSGGSMELPEWASLV